MHELQNFRRSISGRNPRFALQTHYQNAVGLLLSIRCIRMTAPLQILNDQGTRSSTTIADTCTAQISLDFSQNTQ